MKKLLTISIASIIGISAMAQTTVGSIISSNQVWNKAGSPYLVKQNTNIIKGTSVKIMPGTTVLGANGVTLIVDGELQALGKPDTMIHFNSVSIQYNSGSADFNPATRSGALLSFTEMDSTGNGNMLSVTGVTMRVEYCNFITSLFGISYMGGVGTDVNKFEILNCYFSPQLGQSFDLRSYGPSQFVVKNNVVKTYRSYANISGAFEFEGNTVENSAGAYFSMYQYGIVKCNHFKNINTVDISTTSSMDSGRYLLVEGNTFDSMGYYAYPMVKISDNISSFYPPVLMNVIGNNFLYNKGLKNKLEFYGNNPDVTKFKLINCKSNYWGGTDTNQIKKDIKDYADDITIFAKANYSGYLTAQDTTCGESVDTFCRAHFTVAVDSTDNNSFYVIENSTHVDANTKYDWTFGKVQIKNTRLPNFYYSSTGKIMVCLHIYNSKTDCNSIFCDSVGYDYGSDDSGFSIQALGWEELSTKKPGNSGTLNTVKAYPNPAGEMVNITLSAKLQKNPEIMLFNIAGAEVYHAKLNNIAAQIQINTGQLNNGVYQLVVRNGKSLATTKIVIQK